jgi:catechol 2,3-dioxygenase-like lactoylglutathione lyase family enzyme
MATLKIVAFPTGANRRHETPETQPPPMNAPISGIDHAIVGVRDLEAARRAYAHLGFTVTPRGRHIGWATANYCIMFANDYIELLGIVDATQFTNNLDRFLAVREGLMSLAYATGDAAAATETLRARGIAADGPKDLKRDLELPDGTVQPAFKLTYLPAEVSPAAPSFICQHLSRPLVWQKPWQTHDNGARGILSLTGVVADPDESAVAYGRLFGPAAVSVRRECVEVDVGGAALRLATAEGVRRLYPGLSEMPDYPRPWLCGLRLAVDNLSATAAAFDARRISYFRDGDRVLRLPAEMACGVVLEFTED